MNRDFIPYQQALELKELGFDELCFGFYDVYNDYNLYFFKNQENKNEVGTIITNSTMSLSCLAPTFSQAFRWFREKHGLQVISLYDGFDNKNGSITQCWSYDISKGSNSTGLLTNRSGNFSKVLDCSEQDVPGDYVNEKKFNDALFVFYGYRTYEEAELACLKELISIVKSKTVTKV